MAPRLLWAPRVILETKGVPLKEIQKRFGIEQCLWL